MTKSIIQGNNKVCFLCGRVDGNLECHHIFGGANRRYSDEDGLVVWLCGEECHRNGPKAAHRNRGTAEYLKAIAQMEWEDRYGTREEFMKRYGRNYL